MNTCNRRQTVGNHRAKARTILKQGQDRKGVEEAHFTRAVVVAKLTTTSRMWQLRPKTASILAEHEEHDMPPTRNCEMAHSGSSHSSSTTNSWGCVVSAGVGAAECPSIA